MRGYWLTWEHAHISSEFAKAILEDEEAADDKRERDDTFDEDDE